MNKIILIYAFTISLTTLTRAMEFEIEKEVNKQQITKKRLYKLLCSTYYLDEKKVEKLIKKDPSLMIKKLCFLQASPLKLTNLSRNSSDDDDDKKNDSIRALFYHYLVTCDKAIQKTALNDRTNVPPLCAIAAFCGDIKTFQEELKKNFPCGFAQQYHLNPLFHGAIENNNVEIIKCLVQDPRLNPFMHCNLYPTDHLSYGASYNTPPLNYARKLENREQIIILLEQHPSIQKKIMYLEKKNISAAVTHNKLSISI